MSRIFLGNMLFVGCVAFYLAWWLLAFRPVNPVTGVKSSWLLIPAAVLGVAALGVAIYGIASAGGERRLFNNGLVVLIWIVAFVVLAVATRWLFDRPVTSELFLITGWTALALCEVNALFGSGKFSHNLAVVFIVVIAAILVANLVCYVLFYRLGATARFVDGMIPLLLTGVATAVIGICAI